jgi:Tfp pilus assembly pilus retraction ATPase PilT
LPDKREIDGQEVCEDVSERVELSEAAFAGKNIGLVKFNRLSAASQQEIKDWCVEMMNEKHQKEIQRLQKENFDENEKHQKEIQRLQKENFDKQFIRASELVGMPQRVLTYKMKKNGGTVSATARTPLGVVVWVDFYQLHRGLLKIDNSILGI